MFDLERRKQILSILEQKKSATVHTLAQMLYVSESTVRRDLTALEKSGEIRRTFGGAVLEETLTKEVPLFYRENQNNDTKKKIASRAKDFITNGSVIFLDASTTVAHLVPFLTKFSNLTIITNSPQTSIALGKMGIKNFCTGGILLEHSIAYVGSHAESFINQINADIMFFSSRGYSPEEGVITDSSVEESTLRAAMLKRSAKKIYMCDSSKFGKKYIYRLCTAEDVDEIITDI